MQSVSPSEPVRPVVPGVREKPGEPAGRSSSAGTFDREEALARLGQQAFDVLVIGGGITGAGVALDAASRGLRTALVERHDFASGTSSKSSKMVHGGLRYLQQRDFRLVYEALHERQILLENAPHLVVPLPFLIPLFGRDGVVNKAVSRTYSTALWMYDLTGGWRIGKRHERIGRDEALAHLPTLKADRLVAAFIYYDARTDDARLTLTVARTAALDHGAVVVNYAEVTGLLHRKDGRVAGAEVQRVDPRGERPRDNTTDIEVKASRGHKCDGCVGRRRESPRRSDAPTFAAAGKGNPRHRPAQPVARRHRCGHSRTS